MKLTDEELNRIYDKTDGYCKYCGKKLSWKNYGSLHVKGAWELDHSKAKSRGGTNNLRNLVPACIYCNRDKSDYSSSYRYKKYFKPATLGGQIVDFLGLSEGFLGASRRRYR